MNQQKEVGSHSNFRVGTGLEIFRNLVLWFTFTNRKVTPICLWSAKLGLSGRKIESLSRAR